MHRLVPATFAFVLGALQPIAAAQGPEAARDQEPLRAWAARLSAESGAGTRSFDLPRDGVVYRNDSGVFPVAGAKLELEHVASTRASLGLFARYQTSVGLDMLELHTDGSKVPIEVRAHRFEAGLSPTIRFNEAGSWALALTAGYGVLGFRPLLHLVTPAYTLSGPLLRAQLQLPIVSDALRLRIGPEGQWIVQVGGALRDRGIDAMGFALGGEAALELSIGRHLAVHAGYREAWSVLGSSQATSFKDIARFATAGVTWTP